MNPWILTLKNELAQQANPTDALWMKNYMRNQFEFMGVKKPVQLAIFKRHLKSLPDASQYLQIANEMMEMEHREFHYLAMVLVMNHQKLWDDEIPAWVEKVAVKYPWWDIIDVLAPKILGPYFKKFPSQRDHWVDRWMQSEHIWLQRLCIIFSLEYKEKVDTEYLAAVILPLASSKEFFIQKAIGWMLRQYARTNPAWVREFVQKYPLAALSKREALKRI